MTVEHSREAADSAAGTAAEVGPRIKTVRQARRMTIETLAEASGLTKSFLSKVERGRSTPSVAALLRIAAALEFPLASLFENSTTRHVVRSENYPRIEFGGEALNEFLLTPQAEQRVQAILSRIQPGGGSGNESYQLPGEVEFVYVVDGVLEMSFPDSVIVLGTGDAATFEPSTHRSFRVPPGSGVATVLWVIAPALPRTERRGI
jgi:transcriptional regulator with XRE-family HTH domain